MPENLLPPYPPTEVAPRAQRRVFTAEYKRRVLQEADACRKPGEISALLRREGLYSSLLSEWRRARELGELAGATPRRGPKPTPADARDERIAALEKENARLLTRAVRAEALVELQKKVAEILGRRFPDPDETP